MISGTGFNRSKMPRTLVCYICGREYGTKSLGIHLKTCVKKWEIAESQKPKRERRPVPACPPALMKLLDKKIISELDLKEYNNEAFDNFNTSVLVPCKNCGRTFSESALKHHSKACTADRPFKPLPGFGGNDLNKSKDNTPTNKASQYGKVQKKSQSP